MKRWIQCQHGKGAECTLAVLTAAIMYNARHSVPGVKGAEYRQLSIPAANLDLSTHLCPWSAQQSTLLQQTALPFVKFIHKALSQTSFWIPRLHSRGTKLQLSGNATGLGPKQDGRGGGCQSPAQRVVPSCGPLSMAFTGQSLDEDAPSSPQDCMKQPVGSWRSSKSPCSAPTQADQRTPRRAALGFSLFIPSQRYFNENQCFQMSTCLWLSFTKHTCLGLIFFSFFILSSE